MRPRLSFNINQSLSGSHTKKQREPPPQIEEQEGGKKNTHYILRSFANHTLPSTLTGVGVFFGTRTCGAALLIEW